MGHGGSFEGLSEWDNQSPARMPNVAVRSVAVLQLLVHAAAKCCSGSERLSELKARRRTMEADDHSRPSIPPVHAYLFLSLRPHNSLGLRYSTVSNSRNQLLEMH